MPSPQDVCRQGLADIAAALDLTSLEEVRIAYLGRQGQVTQLMQQLRSVPTADKPSFGQAINQLKDSLQQAWADRKRHLQQLHQLQSAEHRIDVSLPGRADPGHVHPVWHCQQRIINFFSRFGFTTAEGPEIETQAYNFDALNMPDGHPARAMQDTFYFPNGDLLRTHTSPVQIRSMLSLSPPLRLIAPGRVYRCDSDVTHTPMFHQVEGLMVDPECSFAQLKAVLQEFLQYFFQQTVRLRFRPSYFPFTEPSAEVDMQCTACHGQGCRICRQSGWLEILGCGMVHPSVLDYCQIDHQQYRAWAFGVGIDRLCMLYYQIPDLRMLFDNDMRFLCQFRKPSCVFQANGCNKSCLFNFQPSKSPNN